MFIFLTCFNVIYCVYVFIFVKVFLGTDINEHAARVSTITATRNKVSCQDPKITKSSKLNGLQLQATLDVVNTDLFGSFTDRLMNSIDIILFNPPYVPTLDEEHAISRAGAAGSSSSNAIYAAWAGGEDGMRTTNIFLANVKVRFLFVLVFIFLLNIEHVRICSKKMV